MHSLRMQGLASAAGLDMPNGRQLMLAVLLVMVAFNTSFWTLSLEARWYLLLPPTLLLQRHVRTAGLVVIAVVVSVAAMLLSNRLSPRVQVIVGPLPLYLPLFVLGIAAAEMVSSRKLSREAAFCVRHARWGLVLSLLLIAWFTPAVPEAGFPYRRIIPAGLLAFFLLLLALYDDRVKQWLSWRPLTAIGLFSYSLYLTHLPLIHGLHAVTERAHWSPAAKLGFYEGLVMPACVLIGYLFYRVAEKPFLRRQPVRQQQQVASRPQCRAA
jgi:peptidoglycan/LPS O-acetylase OafA/YrhL